MEKAKTGFFIKLTLNRKILNNSTDLFFAWASATAEERAKAARQKEI